jgi:Tetratricopeptide repeat
MLGIVLGLSGGVGAAVIGAWAVLHARRPTRSSVELVSVTIGERAGRTSPMPTLIDDHSPVLDVKVRNTGGQPAVLKHAVVHVQRAVRCGTLHEGMQLTAYRVSYVGANLPVSATYDVSIPRPEDAVGTAAGTGISQVVAAGEADRFQVRLGMAPTLDTYAYQVTLELTYDGDDRTMTSAPVAAAFPDRIYVHPADSIRKQIREFFDGVAVVRAAIDREMTARGLPAPDWESAPPRRREELPGGLVAVDGMAHPFQALISEGVFEVTDAFWDPERSVALHVREFGRIYGELEKIVDGAADVDDVLRDELPRARATLAGLNGLYAEFPLPSESPARENTQTTKTPAGRMQDLLHLWEEQVREEALAGLRATMLSGDEATLWFLGQIVAEPDRLRDWMEHNGIGQLEERSAAAEFLDEFLRTQRPDDPEAFRTRRTIAQKLAVIDPSGAAAALRRVLNDQVSALGNEHQDTCGTRLDLYRELLDSDDMPGAAAVLVEVVADQERICGHDHEYTLVYRHILASCQRDPRDKPGMAEAFSQMYAHALRVLGPDHSDTLVMHHNLARLLGEAGDPAAAVAEFRKVLADRERVLGDHRETRKSREALWHWQTQAKEAGA